MNFAESPNCVLCFPYQKTISVGQSYSYNILYTYKFNHYSIRHLVIYRIFK